MLRSQNLVPNAGFELYDTCPVTETAEIFRLYNWYDMVVSANYYNCGVGVPNNIFGYQNPNSGTGYIGMGHGEKVAIHLIQPLDSGKIYEIGLYTAPGDSIMFTDIIAILLSRDSLCEFSTGYRQILLTNGNQLNDTMNWTYLSATFVANGCERFLGIDIPNMPWAYYYFDDISLQCNDTTGCIIPQCNYQYTDIIPNIFTPNNDGWNDNFYVKIFNSEPANFNCRIFNRWGEEIAVIDYPKTFWDGKTDNGDEAPDGVYYYFLNFTYTECGEWYSKNGYVHLHR